MGGAVFSPFCRKETQVNAKKLTPEREIIILLKDIVAQLHVDAQRADNGDGGPDVAAWLRLYDEAGALHSRRVRGLVGE